MARNNANTDKKSPVNSSTTATTTTVSGDIEVAKPDISADTILKLMMRIGIPLALISVLSLWVSSSLGSAGIGLLFIITAPLALVIGFAYNIRYVMLLVRQRRNAQPPQNKS